VQTQSIVTRQASLDVNLPETYGETVFWDRNAEPQLLIVAFINPANDVGIRIAGFDNGDLLEILDVEGIAYFSGDDGKPWLNGLVNIVAAGAGVAATMLGQPEVAPLIEAGRQFAQEQFKGTGNPSKGRDGFGMQTDDRRDFAEKEGGVVICLPNSMGPLYSNLGEIESDESRADEFLPEHMRDANGSPMGFFPIRGNRAHNTRWLYGDSPIRLLAWDSNFRDNTGHYYVTLRLSRGELPPVD
jgi:hypothetical protein